MESVLEFFGSHVQGDEEEAIELDGYKTVAAQSEYDDSEEGGKGE